MQTLAFINIKGGVGKTAIAFNLAHILSRDSQVLAVDMDPQGNLSMGFNLDEPDQQIGQALENCDFYNGAMEVTKNLHILPCGTRTQASLKRISGEFDENFKLRNLLKSVSKKYDYCVIDCRPALDTLTINALMVADFVYIPILADPCSVKGVEKVVVTARQISENGMNPGLKIGGIIRNRFDGRKNIARETVDFINEKYPGLLIKAFIREDVKFSESHARHKPIFLFSPKTNGAQDLLNLVKEIKGELHVQKQAA